MRERDSSRCAAPTHKLNRAGRGEQGPTDPTPPNVTASCRPTAWSGLSAANGNYWTFRDILPVGRWRSLRRLRTASIHIIQWDTPIGLVEMTAGSEA